MLKCEVNGEGRESHGKEVTHIELLSATWDLITNPLIAIFVILPMFVNWIIKLFR